MPRRAPPQLRSGRGSTLSICTKTSCPRAGAPVSFSLSRETIRFSRWPCASFESERCSGEIASLLAPSCLRLSRASTAFLQSFGKQDVDGGDKPGHDLREAWLNVTGTPRPCVRPHDARRPDRNARDSALGSRTRAG